MRIAATALVALAACSASPGTPGHRPGVPHPNEVPVAAPADLGFDAAGLDSVVAYLRSEVDSGAFPGGVVAVGRHGQLALLAAVGTYGSDDPRPVTTSTVYDLASVTKVVGLTTAVLLLVDEGKIGLDDPVQRWVPAFRGADKERVTVRHLLTHSSGLPAWRPLYTEATTRAGAFALADTAPLAAPPGTTMVYSDLGAIVLTQIVETVTGERLDRFLDARVFRPLGLRDTRYLPPADWRDRIAPTERSQDGTIIRGTVHDENAWRLGGVSGHAGLFSTAGDLARVAVWWLEVVKDSGGLTAGRRVAADTAGAGPGGLTAGRRPAVNPPNPSSELMREFIRRQDLPSGSTRALGWDTPSDSGYSSAGALLSRRSFGHTGFTGTSLWMDPERDLFVILLTNRVHPTRENALIGRVRPRVADLVAEALRW